MGGRVPPRPPCGGAPVFSLGTYWVGEIMKYLAVLVAVLAICARSTGIFYRPEDPPGWSEGPPGHPEGPGRDCVSWSIRGSPCIGPRVLLVGLRVLLVGLWVLLVGRESLGGSEGPPGPSEGPWWV